MNDRELESLLFSLAPLHSAKCQSESKILLVTGFGSAFFVLSVWVTDVADLSVLEVKMRELGTRSLPVSEVPAKGRPCLMCKLRGDEVVSATVAAAAVLNMQLDLTASKYPARHIVRCVTESEE